MMPDFVRIKLAQKLFLIFCALMKNGNTQNAAELDLKKTFFFVFGKFGLLER